MSPSDDRLALTRRGLLQLGAVGTFAAQTVPRRVAEAAEQPAWWLRTGPEAAAPPPTFTTLVRRREDQLALRVDCYGLDLITTPEPLLVAVEPTGDLVVVITFVPQHVGEEAYYELSVTADDSGVLGPPLDPPSKGVSEDEPKVPVGSRIAGGTRLAFLVPPGALPIPFTMDGLLDWASWTPAVVATARGSRAIEPVRQGTSRPILAEPTTVQTAIELPWWLLLSPHRQTAWAHASAPATHDGRTELWHTRLAGKPTGGLVNEHDQSRKTVRAVWARDPVFPTHLEGLNPEPVDGEDYSSTTLGMPFRTAVSPRDRFDLVLSSAYYAQTRTGFKVPDPIKVDELTLTSRGAWIDAAGSWLPGNAPPLAENNLQSWRHIATGGRDQYVRIVRSGHLCGIPFGASLFKVTERTFRTVGSGRLGNPKKRVAYLVQRYFVVLRERELVFDGTRQPDDGHRFPFTRVRAKTMITPTIEPPSPLPKQLPGMNLAATEAFVIRRTNGSPFLFEMEGTDRAGRPVDLLVPALFIDGTIADDIDGDMDKLRDWYNDTLDEQAPERVIQLRGQLLAPAKPSEPGGTDTDIEVHRLTLGLERPTATVAQLRAEDRPGYSPTMTEAEVRLSAAETVLGAGMAGELPVMVLDPGWIEHGFGTGQTKGEVFVRLKDWQNPTNSRLNFADGGRGDRAGGLVAPSLGITGLSRRTGTIGGNPQEFQQGSFDPTTFFGSLKANLLGDIPLTAVVKPAPSNSDEVLKLTRRETTDAFTTELGWTPKVTSVGAFVASTATTLDIRAVVSAPKAQPQEVSSVVTGELRNFDVVLLQGAEFLTVSFNRLAFRAANGAKSDVDVEIREVKFAGALEFVEDLSQYLQFDSGGFSVDLLPTRLDAGLELPIPSIPLVVFSLQNLTFSAGMTIPFTGKPVRFRFGFNTVDNPFLVSVMIFGGGGSFELAVGTDGVEAFQVSFEFGFVGALDFGVASGSISITAGIYLAIGVMDPPVNPDGKAALTGFLKIKGEVEVLGLISLGIFMKAAFTYIPALRKAVVKATIIVEVDVLLFSGEAEIEYEKRFGGNDPTFGDSMTQQQWVNYTAAFAPIGA